MNKKENDKELYELNGEQDEIEPFSHKAVRIFLRVIHILCINSYLWINSRKFLPLKIPRIIVQSSILY